MLALSTDTLKGYGLNRIFEFAKQAGYDGIDLYVNEKDFDTTNTKYVKKLSDEFSLPVLAIQIAKTTPKSLKIAIDIAKEVNTRVIIVQPPKILNFKQISWFRKEIPKLRAKEKISIALENAPAETILGIIPKHAMNNLAELKRFKHACIDTSRIAEKKQDIMRIYNSLKKYLVHIHLSNVKGVKKYFFPDDGILPLESFMTKLKQDGFKGTISMKVNPKFLKAGDDEKMMEALERMKKYYEKYFIKGGAE